MPHSSIPTSDSSTGASPSTTSSTTTLYSRTVMAAMPPDEAPKSSHRSPPTSPSEQHPNHPYPSHHHQHLHAPHHLGPPVADPAATVPHGLEAETEGFDESRHHVDPVALSGEEAEKFDKDVSIERPSGGGEGGGDAKAGEEGGEMIDGRQKDIYDRFSPRRKTLITCVVSYSAFLAPMSASSFLPSIPQMAVDLHTTPAVINYTVAVFIVTIGITPLIFSPFAGFYGRRPVYLTTIPVLVVASVGVALSKSVADLIGTRILQGIGGSSVLAVGAGTIGDIYRPTERATAMGWFYSGALMGPALSPVIAGIFAEYTAAGWRAVQYFITGMAALSVLLIFLFLPETAHPPVPHEVLKKERGVKFVWFRFNPLAIFKLFAWPNICLITLISSFCMLEIYTFIIPLSSVFKDQYNIHNAAIAGCLYLASGGGNFIGARIAGPWADATVRRYIAKRGHRRPEDRLRAALLAAWVLMPLSCIAYGWLVQYQAGGLGPPIVMLIISGAALMMILTPVNTYALDVMQKRGAEVIAVNNFVRYMFSAAASAFVLPMSDAIGWGLTMTIAAIICWLAAICLVICIRYGHILREKANKRYGYVDTNAALDAAAATDEEKGHVRSQTSHGSHCEDTVAELQGGDEHMDLVAPVKAAKGPKVSRRVEEAGESKQKPAVAPVAGTAGPGLSRQGTRTSMPGVEEVLKRTVSLSGASVHGG